MGRKPRRTFICITSGADEIDFSEVIFEGATFVDTSTEKYPNSCQLVLANGCKFFVTETDYSEQGCTFTAMKRVLIKKGDKESTFETLWAPRVHNALTKGYNFEVRKVLADKYFPEYVSKNGTRSGIGYAVLDCVLIDPKEANEPEAKAEVIPSEPANKESSCEATVEVKNEAPDNLGEIPGYGPWADAKASEGSEEYTTHIATPFSTSLVNAGWSKIFSGILRETQGMEKEVAEEKKAELLRKVTGLSVKKTNVSEGATIFDSEGEVVGFLEDLSAAEKSDLESAIASAKSILVGLELRSGEFFANLAITDFSETLEECRLLAQKSGAFKSQAEFEEHYNWLLSLGLRGYMLPAIFKKIKFFEDAKSRARIPGKDIVAYKDSMEVLPQMVTDVIAKRGIALVGAKSVGKNVALITLARIFLLPLYEFSVTEETTEDKIKGGKVFSTDENGNTVIIQERVQLVDWAENGGIFVFDEMNTGRPGVMALMNPLADSRRYFEVPGARHVMDDSCVIALTYNDGDGAFNGTQELNEATLSRFSVIRFQYPLEITEILRHTASARGFLNKDTEKRISICNDIWKQIYVNVFSETASLSPMALNIRGIEAALAAGSLFGEGVGDHEFVKSLERNLFNGIADEDERVQIESIVKTFVSGITDDTDEIDLEGDHSRY